MADATATFAIVLEDETSGAASAAASSLDDLQSSIEADTKALSQLNKAMRQMKAGGLSGSSTFSEMKTRADALKASIGQQQSSFVNLGGTFGKTASKAAPAVSKFAELGGALKGANGPLGAMAGGLSRLGPLLTNPITLVVALAAAYVALAVAIVAATAALLKFGIAQSGARRSEALQIEGLNTIRHQWGRTTASVEEFQAAIDRASDSTNVGRGTLQTYARQLSRAGLRGEALTEAVEAMGIAAQVQGDRGASRFRALALNARLTGGSVRDLAADYRNRLGPIARRQMLSIDNQTDRARRSLDRIFSGLNIEGFLSGLDEVLSLLSQSTATGRALKAIVETIFQPMIDQISFVGPLVKRFFQGFVIGALVVIIWVQRIARAIGGLFGDDLVGDVNLARAALFLGIAVFAALVTWAGLLAAGMVFLAATTLLAMAPWIILGALIVGAFALGFFAAKKFVEFWEATDFAGLGRSMIDGLINGIRSGAAALTSAVRGVATSAASAFTSALGIESPSTVFAGFGMNIAQGAAQGIEAGTPAVEDAADALVDAPQGGGSQGGSTSISIGDVVIQGGNGESARELALAFRDELAAVLEGVSIEMGVPT